MDIGSVLTVIEYTYKWVQAVWRWLREQKSPPLPPVLGEADYLSRVGLWHRLAPWDTNLLLEEPYLSKHHVRYEVRRTDNPDGLTGSAESPGNLHQHPFSRFVAGLLKRSRGLIQPMSNVFLVQGAPGVGKTVLAVQLLTYAVGRRRKDTRMPLPIFINLKHWDAPSSGESWLASLERLIANAVAEGCPRWSPPRSLPEGSCWWADFRQATSILFIFDGLDETPEDGYSDRCAGLGVFIHKHAAHTFVITCRPKDYIPLGRCGEPLKLQRYDLLELAPGQVRRNLSFLDVSAEQINEILRRRDEQPLHALRLVIPDFESFVTQRVAFYAPHAIRCVLRALESLAWQKKIPMRGQTCNNSRNHLNLAAQAGLIVAQGDRYDFTTRHLESYFLARRLADLVRKDEQLQPPIALTNINVREAWSYASDILWANKHDRRAWLRVLGRILPLDGSGTPNRLRMGLEAVSDIVRRKHVCEDTGLRDLLFAAIRSLVNDGGAEAGSISLEATARLPELLQCYEAAELLEDIRKHRPPKLKYWATRVLSQVRSMGWSMDVLWLRLLWSTLPHGLFGKSVRFWLRKRLENHSRVWVGLAIATAISICFVVALVSLFIPFWLACFLGWELPGAIVTAEFGWRAPLSAASDSPPSVWPSLLVMLTAYVACRWLARTFLAFRRFTLVLREATAIALFGGFLLALLMLSFAGPLAMGVVAVVLCVACVCVVSEQVLSLGFRVYVRQLMSMDFSRCQVKVKELRPRPWIHRVAERATECVREALSKPLFRIAIGFLCLLLFCLNIPFGIGAVALSLFLWLVVIAGPGLRLLRRIQRCGFEKRDPKDVLDIILDARELGILREECAERRHWRGFLPTRGIVLLLERGVNALDSSGEFDLASRLVEVLIEFRHELAKNLRAGE